MQSDRLQQIETAFAEAKLLEGTAREEFLAALEPEDPALVAEVRSLLAADTGRVGDVVGRAAAEFGEDAGGAADDGTVPDLRFGPYRAVRLLGAGGMGAVYLGRREGGGFEQTVALKVMRSALVSPEARARFLAERSILAGLQHDGIARLVDGGFADDGVTPWFAMEYVDGRPLSEALDEASLEERIAVFLEVCAAVQYAHRNLVVHRDLKPSNILVDGEGRPKLLDFGIAKVLSAENAAVPAEEGLTREGSGPMTPSYAAPEQVSGAPVTTGTDVYTLGVLLYELLAGRYPFDDERRSGELQQAILRSTPPRPSRAATLDRQQREAASGIDPRRLSGDLDNICLMALRKEPERRYASVADLAADLRRWLERRPVEATPDSVGYRLRKLVQRRRDQVLTVAAAAVLLVALTVAYGVRLARERDVALAASARSDQIAGFLVDLFSASDPSVSLGADVSARELLDLGVERIDVELPDQPDVRADLLHVMGDVHKRLGLYDRSLELLTEAAELDADLGSSRDAARALSLYRAGEVHLYAERFDEADALLLQALELQRGAVGEPSAEVADTLDLLGRLERERKEFDAAEAYHQQALAMRRELFDEGSLPISESLQSLAMLRTQDGRLEESIELSRRALAIRASILGDDHPEAIELRQNIASTLQRTGDFEEALAMLDEVLEGVRRTYGEGHLNTSITLSTIAYSLQQLGRLEEAVERDRQAVEIHRRLGADPSGVTTLVQYGRHLTELGRLDEAEAITRESLVWLGDTPEDPSPRRSNILVSLGTILTQRGRYAEAREALEDTLRLDIDTYGEVHPYVAQDRYKLGDLARVAGDHRRALEWLDLALERQRQLRPGANALGLTLISRGETLLAMGRPGEAEAAFREALEVFAVNHPEEHPDFATARMGLGSALAAGGDPAQARQWLERAAQELEGSLGPSHPRTLEAGERLAALR